jgi:tRNA (guanine37-N1)-methyltransferase
MRITVLTLFPEMYRDFLSTSIIGRAVNNGLVDVDFVQIRDFSKDKFKHVDDTPYGGGMGQVMQCQPVLDALHSVKTENSYSIMMSPLGKTFNQQKSREFAKKDHLIILCGHYEGLDARINHYVDELVSIGDYVLTGGEIASMVIMDSVIRLLEGSISEGSTDEESFENGLLEYPQYTKPRDYEGELVPDVLLSGNHAKIREWRVAQSLLLTKEHRPDLYEKHEFTDEERKVLKKIKDGKI